MSHDPPSSSGINTQLDLKISLINSYENSKPFHNFVDLCQNSVQKGEITFDQLLGGLLLAKDFFIRQQELLIRDNLIVQNKIRNDKEKL